MINKKTINLISDTVTRPTPEMRDAIAQAVVGDDVFAQDPTVNKLETKVADMFGKEAAVFCPSGTMANQIAIKTHTNPMDEMICERNSHVYLYEAAGYSFNSGIGVQLLDGDEGRITADQVNDAIRKQDVHFPQSKLVVLENSCNRAGGSYYRLDQISPIAELCRANGLKLHLDGARLFNVLVETGDKAADLGKQFDTLSICLSKGLGAPVGTVLCGSDSDIAQARRYRKVMGGGMRQAGILAAAGIYALDHHIERLQRDNAHARILESCLSDCRYVQEIKSVYTNIVIFRVVEEIDAQHLVEKLQQKDILCLAFSKKDIRFVTHLDCSRQDVEHVCEALRSIEFDI